MHEQRVEIELLTTTCFRLLRLRIYDAQWTQIWMSVRGRQEEKMTSGPMSAQR
jgi:hypothetical protein